MSQAIYRKWRPARFDAVVGQEHVTRTLQNAVAGARVGHAYLFCGPRGTGKTTIARLLAKAVNCLEEKLEERPCGRCAHCQAVAENRFLDLIEIDAASNTSVDDVRGLRDKINFAPSQGRFKVYIIDEVHMLSMAAFNALLKTLEEPPPRVKFILATTEEHKVPATIKSRCQHFNFRLLTIQEIVNRLLWLAEREGLLVEPEALALVARQGAGSLRDAESLLDQLVVAPGDTITLERAQQVLGTASSAAVRDLTAAWIAGNGAAGLGVIHQALARGADARQFARQIVAYLRQLLLLHTAGPAVALDVPDGQRAEMMMLARRVERGPLVEAIKRFNAAATTTGVTWHPELPLELALVELLPEAEPAAVGHGSYVTRVASGSQPSAASTQPSEASDQPRVADKNEIAPEASQTVAVVVPEDELAQDQTPIVKRPPLEQAERPVVVSPRVAATLASVTAQWREITTKAGERNKNLPPLLAMGKPLSAEGLVLILGFDYEIFKDKFDSNPMMSRIMAEVLSEVVGAKWTVRTVVTGHYASPPSPAVPKDDFHTLAQELGGVVRES